VLAVVTLQLDGAEHLLELAADAAGVDAETDARQLHADGGRADAA
jgi:hypothetical protein